MALRFTDPSATKPVEVDGATFTVGFWPPRESARLAALVTALRKIEDQSSAQAREINLELHRKAVEYGIREWSGWDGAPDPKAAIESEEINGRKYPKVSALVLDSLCISGLVWDLGAACAEWNNLTPEEKKRSDAPSDSGTPSQGTSATPASPSSDGSTA